MSEGARISAKIPEAKKDKKVLQKRRNNQSTITPIDRIMFLQRTMGNKAVQRLFSSGALMPKTGECARRGNERSKLQHESDNLQLAAVKSNEPVQGYHDSQIRISHQNTSEDEETDKYSEDGLLIRNAGSGTCVNGGAESVCNPNSGNYTITANNNTCCTKDCSRQHEQKHVDFETSSGCCKALSVAWNKAGANRAELARKYNGWVNQTESIAECQAYSNDVTCADALAKTKDCAGAGKDTDCCKDIEDYKTKYGALAKIHCAKAPKNTPPCPVY